MEKQVFLGSRQRVHDAIEYFALPIRQHKNLYMENYPCKSVRSVSFVFYSSSLSSFIEEKYSDMKGEIAEAAFDYNFLYPLDKLEECCLRVFRFDNA